MFRALRQRWWILPLAAFLAAGAAYTYTRAPWVEPRWRATVWVQAAGRFDYGTTLALDRQLRVLAEQVRQANLMREVDQRLQLDLPPDRLVASVRSEPIQDSSQIRIDVDDTVPSRAEAIAIELARTYSDNHNAGQQGTVRTEQVLLRPLDRPVSAALIWPQTRVIVPSAALLGLLAAALAVLALAYLDNTLRTPQDVRDALGVGVIGIVPREPAAASGIATEWAPARATPTRPPSGAPLAQGPVPYPEEPPTHA